jgi:ElaB/YqjD/DUF883 family membrane-anchored ribosome-binding protein
MARAGTTEEMIDKASETARGAADQASDLAERAVDRGREAATSVKEVTGTMKEALDTSLKNQPMATLAVAVALGFVLGALWRS